MNLRSWLLNRIEPSTKLNPGQRWINSSESDSQSNEPERSYIYYYNTLEVVNRAVNMIVDDAAEVNFAVGKDKVGFPTRNGLKNKTVNTLLNQRPNPYQDLNSFRRDLLMDLMLDGNAFIYFDGAHLYALPANRVTVYSSPTTYIDRYVYETIEYTPDEIIHIKDNSTESIFRGSSRLRPAISNMRLLTDMRGFQSTFFKNNAIPGLIIKSPDTLSDRIKQRMKESWKQEYRPTGGGRNPLILDGGMEVDSLSNVNFKELDFEASIVAKEQSILKCLGIPPVLLDSSSNSNTRPNLRMFYLETILPIIQKFSSAYSAFFGFEVYEDVTGVMGLQPELRDEAAYYATLVNTGIITPNEARFALGKEAIEGADELRIPQNIAGSSANPSQGGRPTTGNNNE